MAGQAMTPESRSEWRKVASGPSHGVNINSRVLLALLDELDTLSAAVEQVRAVAAERTEPPYAWESADGWADGYDQAMKDVRRALGGADVCYTEKTQQHTDHHWRDTMASTSRTIAEVTMNYRIVQVEDGGVSRYTVESTHLEEPHILSTFDNLPDARANMVTRIQNDEE